ncbi:MAG: leucine-rich repeat domain-containing protein, partial [Clostridia bacterium]|nr:leucine-rich repeat domain-containing protein [Clostridia bacterium]
MLMMLLQCLSAVACNIRYNEKDAPKNDSVQSNDESVPSFTPLASGQTENGLSWDISDSGTLTISGSGVMPDYAYNTMPWYGNAARVTKLVISEGVQNVGRCAFYGFNGITEVTLPRTMTVIGEYAFFGCSALKRIAIPENVFSIGAYAFRKSGVTAFEFAKTKGWTADGNEVDVTLATNLTGTCYKMTFTRTEVDETTEEILAGGFRFRLSEDGKSYELLGLSGYLGSALLIYGALNGKPVTTIAPEAFMDCSSFTSLIIEDGVTTLGDRAFANCSSLQLVILPASIISIGDSVFNNSPEAEFYFEEGFGESEEFTAGEGNDSINEESAWFYSEEEPEWDGNYWRYVLGIPVQWEKTEPDEPERPEGPYVPEDASVYVPDSADWDGRSFVVLTYQDRSEGQMFNVVDLTVKDGDWTIENLNYWAKKAVIEDNSGYYNKWELDNSYQYGLYFQDECATVLLQSSGVTPFIKTSSGNKFTTKLYTIDMQKNIDAIRDYFMLDNTINNAWALNINDVNYSGGDVWHNIARGGFMADKALFYMCHVGTIPVIRGMEHDFGILPVPKLSASQENYGNTVQYGNATCYSVPYNTPDPDFSGFMLEALCYYSSLSYSTVDSLKMAYYETLLQRKASRDDDSWDMLPLVFDNRIFDIACAKNTGNING